MSAGLEAGTGGKPYSGFWFYRIRQNMAAVVGFTGLHDESHINEIGELMRQKILIGWLFLALLALMPTGARAEMYVEGYAGYVRAATVFRDYLTLTTHHPTLGTYEEHHTRGTSLPAVIGGVKLGTWFTNQGVLGFSYPSWMKYCGFYLDFNYHRQNFRRRLSNTILLDDTISTRNIFESNGNTVTLAFMFAGRYGYLANDEVPFGRLQPYLGVGPAVMFTTQDVTLSSRALVARRLVPYTINPGSETDVALALALEPGLRWMFSKNISLDLSFKFRWAHPSFTYQYIDPLSATNESFTLHPQYLILSVQLGAAYHF
jgi:hypothetical protein